MLLPEVEIRRISKVLRIKGLSIAIYNINDYILILIYLPRIKDGIKVLYRIIREIYLVDNLKAYILIRNDIVSPE